MKVKIDFDKAAAKQATRVVGKHVLILLGLVLFWVGFTTSMLALFQYSVTLGIVAVLCLIVVFVWVLTYVFIKGRMTKAELIPALRFWNDEDVVVGQYEDTGWDNILRVEHLQGNLRSGPVIIFGGGSPFSDE